MRRPSPRVGPAAKQLRRDHVHADVGALRGEDRGDEQLERRFVFECAGGTGVIGFQTLERAPLVPALCDPPMAGRDRLRFGLGWVYALWWRVAAVFRRRYPFRGCHVPKSLSDRGRGNGRVTALRTKESVAAISATSRPTMRQLWTAGGRLSSDVEVAR